MVKKKTIVFVLVLALVLSVAPTSMGAGEKVEAATPDPVTSFDELKDAVSNAAINDVITISTSGTIVFKDTIEITTSVSIVGSSSTDKVKLIGPENGRHFKVPYDNLYSDVELTFQNLSINGPVTTGGGVEHIKGKVVVDECTFKENKWANTGDIDFGGGVYAKDVIIDNSEFTSNSAVDGGGVCADNSVVVKSDSVFSGNYASSQGGAVCLRSNGVGEGTIADSKFINNTANSVGGAVYSFGIADINNSQFIGNDSLNGGGVYLSANNSEYNPNRIINSEFIDCIATSKGGGIYCADYTDVENTILTSNSAISGGGIYIITGLGVCIENSKLTNNKASDGGGIFCNDDMYGPDLINSTLIGNTASNNGGGIYTQESVYITNSTLAHNMANDSGGAVYGKNILLYSSSIVNNTAGGGSGIFSEEKLYVYFSIISNNKSDTDVKVANATLPSSKPQSYNETGTVCQEYNVIGEPADFTLTDMFGSVDPKLVNHSNTISFFMPTEKAKVVPVDLLKEKYLFPKADQSGNKRPTSGLACMGSVELPFSDGENTAPSIPTTTTTTDVPNVTKIYSPNKNIYLKKGKSITLPIVATATDSKNPKLIWSSSNSKIATVNQSGKVVAKKKGKVKITVKAENGKSFTFTVNVVTKDKKVKKIAVKGYKSTMKKNQSKYLKVTLNPKAATNGKITFKSSKKSVVAVDKAGKITAKKKGKAKITVKAGGKKKVITITVK